MRNFKMCWKSTETETSFSTSPPEEMLTTADLYAILSRDKRTSSFRGVFASDELPICAPTSSLCVCNTDPSTKGGEHWIVIYFDGKRRAEYFDSFDMHPTVAELEEFMPKNSVVWTRDNVTVQDVLSNACGYHCIFFAIHRCVGFNMNAVVGMYTKNLTFNDVIVKQFVRENVSY